MGITPTQSTALNLFACTRNSKKKRQIMGIPGPEEGADTVVGTAVAGRDVGTAVDILD